MHLLSYFFSASLDPLATIQQKVSCLVLHCIAIFWNSIILHFLGDLITSSSRGSVIYNVVFASHRLAQSTSVTKIMPWNITLHFELRLNWIRTLKIILRLMHSSFFLKLWNVKCTAWIMVVTRWIKWKWDENQLPTAFHPFEQWFNWHYLTYRH